MCDRRMLGLRDQTLGRGLWDNISSLTHLLDPWGRGEKEGGDFTLLRKVRGGEGGGGELGLVLEAFGCLCSLRVGQGLCIMWF